MIKKLEYCTYFLAILFPLTYLIGTGFVNSISILIAIVGFFILINKSFLSTLKSYPILFVYIIFCIVLIISSLFSDQILYSISKSLAYSLYFFFLYAFFEVIKNYKETFLLNFFKILLIVNFILILSVIYELIIKDFNLSLQLTGIFEKKILGIIVLKIVFLKIGLLLHFHNKFKENIFKFLYFYIILSSLILILLSQHRTSFYLFLLGLFIFFIFNKKTLKINISITLISFFVLLMMGLVFDSILYKSFFLNVINSIFVNNKIYLFSEHYNGHYISAFKMFIHNPINGIGPNLFRFECLDEKYIYIYKSFIDDSNIFRELNSCSTHPHNFYIQLLAETGIFGFLIFLSFFIYIFYLMTNLIFKKSVNNNILLFCSLISLFLSFFPFVPSLNFFNSWATSLSLIPLAFVIVLNSSDFRK